MKHRVEELQDYVDDFNRPPAELSRLDSLMLENAESLIERQEQLAGYVPIKPDRQNKDFALVRAGTIQRYCVGAGEAESMAQVWYDQHLKPRWRAPIPLQSDDPIVLSEVHVPVSLQEVTKIIGLFYAATPTECDVAAILDTSEARLEAAAYMTVSQFMDS